MSSTERKNPLGEEKINRLLRQFAIPSIISMLVGSLYNIVDQFFIGRNIGELGNAATNIAFPLSTSCLAAALLFGIGGASAFNISMGKGDKEKAGYYMGNAAVMLFACGVVLCLLTLSFLKPMLVFFGSPDEVLGYAMEYTRITALGFPFLILSTGGGHLIRADGRPKMTMACNLTGAVINTVLDAVFVFGFGWGMKGAAFATIIGQFISGTMAVCFLAHGKTIQLKKEHLLIAKENVIRIASLGMAPCSNQIAMMVVQIIMNKSLKYYGELSVYGDAIPIACSGIISKVNMVFMSFIIGISQGLQPIASFNYGAGKYARVKEAYLKAVSLGFCLALTAFLLFQFCPRQIISVFGDGSEEYYRFAENYFHIFLLFTFVNFLQPMSSNFFTAIGKPKRGSFLALTRQIIFLLPLLVLFPLFMGIDGVMYAGPFADGLAAVVAAVMVVKELRRDIYRAAP
ncbi:MAG: MATE family efflux transporter [Bacteroidales bacterium]|nr:MATE family efflux transporter [Clostridium sp.]MCM1203355.1 MATE family efflux transporter [Bacteroidales bacterium]